MTFEVPGLQRFNPTCHWQAGGKFGSRTKWLKSLTGAIDWSRLLWQKLPKHCATSPLVAYYPKLMTAICGLRVMKTFAISLLLGLGIEAALVAALVIGGIGPCGPASPVSGFVLLIHTPGFFLMSALHIPDSIGLLLVAALYTVLWSMVPFLVLRGRS